LIDGTDDITRVNQATSFYNFKNNHWLYWKILSFHSKTCNNL